MHPEKILPMPDSKISVKAKCSVCVSLQSAHPAVKHPVQGLPLLKETDHWRHTVNKLIAEHSTSAKKHRHRHTIS